MPLSGGFHDQFIQKYPDYSADSAVYITQCIRRRAVKAPVGTQKGKPMELLVLKEPKYIHWVLDKPGVTDGLLAIKNEAKRLTQVFDKKPYQVRCQGCKKPATRLSVHGNTDPMWWCDSCDPYQEGAADGKLQIFRTYSSALSHVELFCGSRASDYRDLIKAIARAKGLPARVGEAHAEAFFHKA
jgi:hypothetical protein